MSRSYARQIYDITVGSKAALIEVLKLDAVVKVDSNETHYTLKDGSTIDIDNFGGIKVDGKYLGV